MDKCCPKRKREIQKESETGLNKRTIETNKLVHEDSIIVSETDNILKQKVCCGEDFILSDFSSPATGSRSGG